MSGGLMSCWLKSDGLMSGGLKSYDRYMYAFYYYINFTDVESKVHSMVGHKGNVYGSSYLLCKSAFNNSK